MASRSLPAYHFSYSVFRRALTATKDRRVVWNIIDVLQASHVAPDAATCAILLRPLTEHSHSTVVWRDVR